jgi:hypothetical protein
MQFILLIKKGALALIPSYGSLTMLPSIAQNVDSFVLAGGWGA